MRTVAIRIDVLIVLRDSPAPVRAALKLDVVDVDTSVNDVDIDALTTTRVVLVLGESAEGKLGTVAYPRKTLDIMSTVR